MTAEPDLDPRALWQGQATETDPMTLAEIHERARAFETRIRRRNTLEYLAGALVVVGFAPVLLTSGSGMMQAGAALVIAATGFVVWQLHRRAGAGRPPRDDDTLLAFHRAELERQRDALRAVGRWYLAPFVPGMALLLLGRWFQSPARGRPVEADHLIILACGGVIALVFLAVWMLNQRGADRLQSRIDALAAQEER